MPNNTIERKKLCKKVCIMDVYYCLIIILKVLHKRTPGNIIQKKIISIFFYHQILTELDCRWKAIEIENLIFFPYTNIMELLLYQVSSIEALQKKDFIITSEVTKYFSAMSDVQKLFSNL